MTGKDLFPETKIPVQVYCSLDLIKFLKYINIIILDNHSSKTA
jgi:hypothetical protein